MKPIDNSDGFIVKYWLAITLIFLGVKAYSGVLLDAGAIYTSDSLSTDSTSSSRNMFYNLGVLISHKKKIWAGWSYAGLSMSNSGETSTTFSAQDMGPSFKWFIDRRQLYSASFFYGLISKVNFKEGSSIEEWSGTSLWTQIAVTPEISEGVRVGASLNYYRGTYSKKVREGTETPISNVRSYIFPMLNIYVSW